MLLPRPSPGEGYLYHPVPGPPSAVWTFLPSIQLYPALSQLATCVQQTYQRPKHNYITVVSRIAISIQN